MQRSGTFEHLPFPDFAKGYAIMTIVLYHALQKLALPDWATQAAGFGGTGVHLFFLLSGFGLGLSRTEASTWGFYSRRLVKVWLPYVFALSISLFAALEFGLFPDGWNAWLAGVGLYQMFSESHIQSFGGHFWFISAIVQFYLAWPLILRWRKRLGTAEVFFGVCLAVSVAWWLLVFLLGKGHLRSWNSFFLQFLWEFALGMLLAERYKTGEEKFPRGDFWNYPRGWNALAAVSFTGLMLLMVMKLGATGRIFNDIPALLGYSALCIFLFQITENGLPALRRLLIWVGGLSYSLYLVHVLVLDFYLQMLEANGLKINPGTLLPFPFLALAAAWVFDRMSQSFINSLSPRPASLRLHNALGREDAGLAPDSSAASKLGTP